MRRPDALNPLFAPVTTLSGIGPKFEKLYRRLLDRDEPRVLDLVFHLPSGVVDRRARPMLRDVKPGEIATVLVTVDRHRPPAPGRSRAPYLVYASDGTGDLIIAYFKARPEMVEKLLPVGETRWVSGTVATYDGMLQMVHPDRVVTEQDVAKMPAVEPVYPLTEGLSPWGVRRAVEAALTKLPALPEWQDAAFLAARRFPGFAEALRTVHRPSAPVDLSPESVSWSRLAYDEFLAGQLALMMVRARMKKAVGRSTTGDGRIRDKLRAALPWTLTASQAKAVEDIAADLEKPERMLRLLQGDVGSGKTVVALFACAAAVEAGSQAALMAPTEILARQHLKTITPLAEKAGLRVAILTGRERGRERTETLARLADGAIDILVGTHAIFQDEVTFRDLALAVVDEQHRFGVHQRLALAQKGRAVDVLVMTATPIPRTLVLTYFGDMDVSELREKPAGRKPIDTRTVALDRIDDVVAAVGRAIQDGRQVYWVCPLVEESETVDLAAAQDRFRDLAGVFGDGVVGLVHGKMRGSEKDAAMAKFAAAETMLLVATTVIEVGVDVPRASVMVIEHADRFGLAQLHQLRGRIGRGSEKSTCLLLYKAPLGEAAKARLATMRETEDGFRIAEEDLKLRGEGDVLGTRQSGLPGFRVARVEIHRELLEAARDDARLIMERDPDLASERGAALRTLLYLFGRDEAVRLLRAG
ncbi:ATP-dependent DNA helicase RecG [Rhodoplanes sp. TEM]|uniref:ATP-dependent DNA helicase RecG n=1 Tax=Rhodoplanes tepidamans TaxID=200616 RepID=A0ABT5JI87_RHOTP|nr:MULTISPECIES: ATP-dependent DNA helicase RecG [Rhodoplanes]MDC7789247.1 ATP-dependent DNA helicase RecG [Rhodoplanes tepidamans]MDC7985815.1 ATP-dependent DNA helicase RecG [Rhodoplanes sp. TEM]MDQ0358859.1 ATP-dependent DNA helicase RecG [Rhodoplanes tepidamans]